ncbi:O-antigen ligase family protein [Thermorudis peleae]|uniref:O-antigen ligase family protein n=1 Tax=Thermorudis peleae TaxID=1382356 RepID=UPI00068AD26E|nr:O-antigen ligase family protein [Thermorudis peleae]
MRPLLVSDDRLGQRLRSTQILGIILSLGLALAIVFLPFPLNLVVPFGLALVVLAVRFPALFPIALIASVPVQEFGAVQLAGQDVTATKLAVAATVVGLSATVFARRWSWRFTWLTGALVLYLSMQALSLRAAVALGPGLAEMYRWTVALIALLATLNLVRHAREVWWLAGIVSLLILAETATGLIQSVLGIAPASFAVTGGLFRAYGTFGKPNPYAGYLELAGLWLFPLALLRWQRVRAAYRRWQSTRLQGSAASGPVRRALLRELAFAFWLTAGVTASILGIGLSFSRGAWLGTAAALIVLVAFAPRAIKLTLLTGAILAVFGLLLSGGAIAPASFRARAVQLVEQLKPFDVRDVQVTPENFATVERMDHWQAGIAMFLAYPWSGVGVGNFNVRFPDFSPHPGFRISQGHAHNYYIHAAAETGLPGLLAYLALLVVALGTIRRAIRHSPTALGRALGLGALAATVALMTHNVVEDLHALNLSVHTLAVWGLASIAPSLADSA